MTQALNNTLNNIENMLTQANEVRQKAPIESGMDKTFDFQKVFEKKVDKQIDKKTDNQTDTNNTVSALKTTKEEVKTRLENFDSKVNENVINDIKTLKDFVKNVANNLKESEESAKEIISQTSILNTLADAVVEVADEVLVESSLDLTLAKDIDEIISQLQNAIESSKELTNLEDATVENLENTSEEVIDKTLTDLNQTLVEDLNIYENEKLENKKNIQLENVIVQPLLNSQLLQDADKEADVQPNTLIQESEDISLDDSIINFAETFDVDVQVNTNDKTVSKDLQIQSEELEIDENVFKELNIESISAETNTDSGSDNFLQQSPEEYGLKAIISNEVEVFDVKIDKLVNVQNFTQTSTKTVDINPSKIIEQVTKHLESLQNNSKVNIVLNPESLGKVNIQLLTSKEGLSAQFTVATQEAREILMKNLDGLKETLLSHGVNVENVSIKLNDSQKSAYNQDWTEQEGSRGGNKEQGQQRKEEKEKGLFEQMMAQTEENNKNGNV